MNKPLAVLRRDIIAATGPSVYGISRFQKVVSPEGEQYTFLGVAEGVVHLERDDKSKGKPFLEVDSTKFRHWKKVR